MVPKQTDHESAKACGCLPTVLFIKTGRGQESVADSCSKGPNEDKILWITHHFENSLNTQRNKTPSMRSHREKKDSDSQKM